MRSSGPSTSTGPLYFTHPRCISNHSSLVKVSAILRIIAVYKQSERFYVVGIEIKEWNKRVHPKMALEYLETYRGTCEYFYLAANKFSKSTLELKDIGLFDLSRMKVVKDPGYLYPDVEFRANLMKRIKNNFKVLTNAMEDPFQRTILEF